MMEGPRHQHLHQEWQEPLEERDLDLVPFLRHRRIPEPREAHKSNPSAPAAGYMYT